MKSDEPGRLTVHVRGQLLRPTPPVAAALQARMRPAALLLRGPRPPDRQPLPTTGARGGLEAGPCRPARGGGAFNSTQRRFASAAMYINAQLPTVYGLAQCTPDLSPGQCWHCFQGLQEQTRQWYDGREGGRILGVRCNIRYEGYQFYHGMTDVSIGFTGSSSTTGSNGSKHRKTLIIVLCVSITVFCSMLVGCLLLIRRLRKGGGKTKLEQGHSRSSSKTEDKHYHHFDAW